MMARAEHPEPNEASGSVIRPALVIDPQSVRHRAPSSPRLKFFQTQNNTVQVWLQKKAPADELNWPDWKKHNTGESTGNHTEQRRMEEV